ncbi:MAG: DUF1015 domain-containing protein [Oscillospiraceae bacterium]|nr:DUF1015 domain-containing protein [Oscillospiraceae bacterium]
MAIIKPFAALRYDFQKAGKPEDVCCPPYDIIPDHGEYTKKSKYNAIRLEGGERLETPDPYQDASELVKRWTDSGILYRERMPAFYLYEASFPSKFGGRQTLKGFTAHVELRPFSEGVVLPHENTLSGPKADREKLMRATGCHFSPIYSLYDDENGDIAALLEAAAQAGTPDHDFTDNEGVRHTMRTVFDPGFCQKISGLFDGKPLFIADGHHRYETSVGLYQDDPDSVSPYVMMFLADMNRPGLEVYATHRIVKNIAGYDDIAMKGRLGERFDFENTAEPKAGEPVWVTSSGCLRVRPKDGAWTGLDVTLLHDGILEPFFGIGAESMARQQNLAYTRDDSEAINLVRTGQADCAFLIAPTQVSQIRETVLEGKKMPQKSTYFYPKIITGLFMNNFRN